MTFSILVLLGVIALCVGMGALSALRGVVHGFMHKRIVIRDQVFEGKKAMAWGGMSLFWTAIAVMGVVLAAIMLARELNAVR
jgi:hypothetical protein